MLHSCICAGVLGSWCALEVQRTVSHVSSCTARAHHSVLLSDDKPSTSPSKPHICPKVQVKDRAFVGPNMNFGDIVVPAQLLRSGQRIVRSAEPLVKRSRAGFFNGTLHFEMQFTQARAR